MRAWRWLVLAALALAAAMIWTGGRWPLGPVPTAPAPDLPGLPPVQRPLPRPTGIPPLPPLAPQITSPVERILIEKAARRMTVWQRDGHPRVFDIALGFAPVGDKARQGDGRTPEGVFSVDRRNDRSRFTLSLGLDYPRPQDRDRARRAGVDPGGDIMIHGQPNQVADGLRVRGDWTAGCIALANAQIRELFAHTALGTPVEIRP
ncbi:L,D-transpeptidase family protein [Paracoccus endophyticus]|uniref:L,D-transpeptidase family protein n=1 Tax=Paracoccus endophyticus TaxID=2233774 RepID=UPI000DDA07C7|nr:L,D-transpeptidase family protein [Paracoccus endophyticus]